MSVKITAVVGGSFGSEGKGAVVAHLCKEKSFDWHIRVGAANAGHTIYVNGEKHVMQQLPCAAYCDRGAEIGVGPGALISPDILFDEMDKLDAWRREQEELPFHQTIWIDARAQVITDAHIEAEQQTDLAARIGSTSTIAREGIGAAQAARVLRDTSCVTAEEYFTLDAPSPSRWETLNIVVEQDLPREISQWRGPDTTVLLEGTQGTGLSNTTGFFPYVTSRNTTVAGLLADSGFAPRDLERTIVVMRTYPIRVAGNSGPFYHDSTEIEWDDIDVDPENERTTVTKLVRRVATFSYAQAKEAVRINGADEIALMFADHLSPCHGADGMNLAAPEHAELASMVSNLEMSTQVPVRYLGTGPASVVQR